MSELTLQVIVREFFSVVLTLRARHIRPGGWVEIQEFDARANCDDGTLADDAPLKRFFDTAEQAVKTFGMDFRAGEKMREPLEKAGFVNVSCVTHKVPIGTWPKVSSSRLIYNITECQNASVMLTGFPRSS